MAVYREGYHAVNEIQNSSIQIYSDACDFGAPTKKGDKIWNLLKQLIDWYGVKESRVEYSTGVTQNAILIDEWAVSDERKTLKQATDIFTVSFTKCTTGACKGYDGFITVERSKMEMSSTNKLMESYLDMDGGIAFNLALYNRFSSISDNSYTEICGGFIEGVHQWASHNISDVYPISTDSKYIGWEISFENGSHRTVYVEDWVMSIKPKNWKHAKNLFNKYLKVKA